MAEVIARAPGHGLYRIARARATSLAYVGEGAIAARLVSHMAKARVEGHRQADHFNEPGLVCSYVVGGWAKHQRLELETDLIANHVEAHRRPPEAQFLG